MVARQRKSRATAGGKRNKQHDEALGTADLPTKRAAMAVKDAEEPGPEPTAQYVARLELKLQELGEENERLKEQVDKLKKQQRGDETSEPKSKSKPKRKWTAKAQLKDKPASARTQPKRKAAKV